MKLTTNLKAPMTYANSKTDSVFDIHVVQKHNAKLMEQFTSSMTQYIKQSQNNEFLVDTTDVDGDSIHDSGLITVSKSSNIYTITTDYSKVFSGALCYDDGIQKPQDIKVYFGVNSDSSINNKVLIVEFLEIITKPYRIVLL